MPRTAKKTGVGGGGLASLMKTLQESVNNDDVIVSTASKMYDEQTWIPFIDPMSGDPCLALSYLVGCKGIPVGRIAQLRASFSAGKSSFLYYIYACATRGRTEDDQKAWIGHIETEGAPNPPDYISRFGLDPNAFLYMSANSLGAVFQTLDMFICGVRGGFGGSVGDTGRVRKTTYTDPIDPTNKYPIILGVDSFSALGDKREASQDVLDISNAGAMAYISRELRRYLRDRQQRFARCNATLFVTSLETAKVATGPMHYGGPQKSALGQEALAGAMSFGFDVADRPWKVAGDTMGSIQSLKTFKNKFAPRYRTAEMFRKDLGGYNIVETDVNFLLTHPGSPFAAGNVCNKDGGRALYRDAGGIHCPMLSDKGYRHPEDFLRAIYDNEDFLMTILEGMRVRGYGFDFETKDYSNQIEKQDDNLDKEELATEQSERAEQSEQSDEQEGDEE